MGPRMAGFLLGSVAAASVAAFLVQYDVLRRKDITEREIDDMETQAALVKDRFYRVQSRLLECQGGDE
ncbi:hypothetical protein DPX39_090034300 [Trypanosoma brucei equiperdum]|nr:hypothetical protein DPX39_090034300 [Trypanosoma brucei equiperdum]